MKKTVFIALALSLAMVFLFSGCSPDDRAEYAESVGSGSPSSNASGTSLPLAENGDSLSMEVSPSTVSVSDKELTLIFHDSSDTCFYYGLEYTLEYYYDGEWKKIDFVPGFEILSVEYLGSDGTELKISLDNHDFLFTPGRYRACKTILRRTLYAEFEMV